MTINLTEIIGAIITLIVALLTTFVIPWIKNKITADKLTIIYEFVKVAVKAVEQTYTESGKGSEKKAEVVAFLESKGYSLESEELDKMIEAAVYDLKQEAQKND